MISLHPGAASARRNRRAKCPQDNDGQTLAQTVIGPVLAQPRAACRPIRQRHQGNLTMPPIPGTEALDYLLTSAGLDLTEAQKADLKSIHDGLAAMKARVRQPRGRMAEPAHIYGFTEADLT
jgi:hypothetical protein